MKRKLTDADVKEIKKLRKMGMPRARVAEKFGVSASTIKYWTHYKRIRRNRNKYMRKYMRDRYRRDRDFRERQRERARIYSRNKRKGI